MSLTLTLTGTGGAQGVPAWGCECAACDRARRSPQYRRQPCSGVVKFNEAITLIDAGLHDLTDRWSPGSFQQFLLTHYHMDHVQGLFPLRADAPRNHCDLNTVLALNQVIRSPRVILTHISHQFDAWLMENALPSGFEVGFDGMEIGVA
ncbi:hypothetical protein A8H80_000855 [Shigella sonnei]|nr:hypothetical protein [Shigella sonnei]EFZ3139926.1 hypothetical protein [Shigella sonnei]EFZ6914697.1 hypothetical protein [Shigella sonnei]EFZ7209952.1 hypothetical protein [Shigella sonnei]ELV7630364.1 hypothetical protein [Shigella sonnei]